MAGRTLLLFLLTKHLRPRLNKCFYLTLAHTTPRHCMRYLFLLLICCAIFQLPAQNALVVTETIFLGEESGRQDPFVRLLLPLDGKLQPVSELQSSTPPSGREMTPDLQVLAWNEAALNAIDSLVVTYRVSPEASPRWNFNRRDLGDSVGVVTGNNADYPLPTLVRADFERTPYAKLRERDRASVVNKILTTLEKRVKVTDDPANFDVAQPLLQDIHRRLTTERRFPQLVSLMLQYYGIEHRLASGKLLADQHIFENQLWVEIKVDARWQRLPATSDPQYLIYAEDFRYLTCSYDYREYTFELFGLPEAEWRHGYQPLALKLWDEKNAALVAKDYDLALRLIDSVITLSDKSIIAVSEKGLIYTEAGNPMEGMKFLQYTLQSAKNNEERALVVLQMSKFYSLQDQLTEALAALEKSNDFAPLDFSVVFTDPRFKQLREDKMKMQQLRRSHPEMLGY